MNSKISLTILLAALISCHKPEPKGVLVDLNGTFKDTLFLSYLKNNFEITDTATLRNDGVYYFNFSKKPHGCYKLIADSTHTFDFIYDQDTLIKVNALINDFGNASIAGSQSTILIKEATDLMKYYERDINTLFNQWQIDNIQQLPSAQRDSLLKQIETVREAYKKLSDSLINKNQGNFANIFIMKYKSNNISLYNIYGDYDRFNRIADDLLQKYPNNESSQGFKEQLNAVKPTIAKLENLEAGKKMVEIEILLSDSTFINLSQLTNQKKAVFVHSYQTGLEQQNSYLPLITTLKQKGFDIYEAYTDSLPVPSKVNWVKGTITKPNNYFNDLPLPIFILIDANEKILFQTPYLNDLKEQLPNL
ncbi:MAG: hypothetical protein KBH01_02280 [Breznakibacter sp.]|nr:hypothetical protein [Breznakibacter sp.]